MEIGNLNQHILRLDADVKLWTVFLEMHLDKSRFCILIDFVQPAVVHVRNHHQLLGTATQQGSHRHCRLNTHLPFSIRNMYALHVLNHIPGQIHIHLRPLVQ